MRLLRHYASSHRNQLPHLGMTPNTHFTLIIPCRVFSASLALDTTGRTSSRARSKYLGWRSACLAEVAINRHYTISISVSTPVGTSGISPGLGVGISSFNHL